jgi:probable dihydroxyacetone kinase regulator
MAERTKLWIAAAMKRLMVKKSLDKIRVTEICREAEIERPTFYYHFQDKYELVAWIFFQDADMTDVLSVESAATSMNRMRQEMLFYRRAYEDSSQNALWQYMLEYFAERYSILAKEKLGIEQLDAQTKYSIRLYCYGCVGMTREWIMQDNITPAEVIVQMMFASMPGRLQQVFFDGKAER